MGSTRQTETTIYLDNSTTGTTETKTFDSEIILNNNVPYGDKAKYKEVARKADQYPGVVGGVTHQK